MNRLRALGHDVLHVTALAGPEMVIQETLERDLISLEALASFAPQALVVVIPVLSHSHSRRN